MARRLEIAGQRFGKLVAVRRLKRQDDYSGAFYWLFKCDCGDFREYRAADVTIGIYRSCRNCTGFYKNIKSDLKLARIKKWIDELDLQTKVPRE